MQNNWIYQKKKKEEDTREERWLKKCENKNWEPWHSPPIHPPTPNCFNRHIHPWLSSSDEEKTKLASPYEQTEQKKSHQIVRSHI